MFDSEDPVDLPDEVGDDLFGDGDADEQLSEIENVLSDRGLDSDKEDDDAQDQREGEEVERRPIQYKEIRVASTSLYRHRIPKSSDGHTVSCARSPRVMHAA